MTAKSDTGVRYAINRIIKSANTRKTTLMVLSCVVVFITTYMLILPAITLEQEEAARQGGIDVATEQQADVTTEDSEDSEDNEVLEEPVASEETAPADMLTFEGKGYEVVTECEGEDLPNDTEVVAKEIGKKDKDYKSLYKDALKAVQKASKSKTVDFAFAKFYDISLMSDGESIEPDIPVDVTISYDKALKVNDADNLRIVHFAVDEESGDTIVEVLDSKKVNAEVKNDKMTAATFEAASFSVYAIVYTVDFEYDVDGQKFTYSIEGGSKIYLADLLLQLQVIKDDPDTEVDEVQLFMDDIDDVIFSAPELVGVGQNDDGEWVLKSLEPFESEETLTVTMKNGDVFTVKVTDYQNVTDFSSFNNNSTFVIWAEGNNGNSYALKTDGTTAQINTSNPDDPNYVDKLGSDFQWKITYGWYVNENETRFYIRPAEDLSKYLYLSSSGNYIASGDALIQSRECGIRIYHSDNNTTWKLEGWNWISLNLGAYTNQFEGNNQYYSQINLSKQQDVPEFEFTVRTEDIRRGFANGKDKDGIEQSGQREYDTKTNYVPEGTKTNLYPITAVPAVDDHGNQKYLFDYWDLNGDRLNFGQEIGAGQLTIPRNKSVLTAHFKKNPDYVVPDEEKDGHSIDKEALDDWLEWLKDSERVVPFEVEGCDKTAEVYDYENRIYRVDLTAQSNLPSFVGDINLGFMLDVSSSMKFPAKLNPVEGLEEVDINHINDNGTNQAWLNQGTTYYLISDKGSTATVYELRWGNWKYNSMGQTRTGWGYKDASKDDSNMNYIRNESAWSGGEVGEIYPIYVDGDPGHNRSYYLERSISNTITELNTILDALSVAANTGEEPKVKVAWNTFHKWVRDPHHDFTSVQGLSVTPTYSYSGGTSADLAMLDAAGIQRNDPSGADANGRLYEWHDGITYSNTDGFHWEDNAAKFAVLITDGAPQRNGIDVGEKLVTDAADFLKNGADGVNGTDDDVTLLTVGLSMGDVKKGSVRLYDISSLDEEGDPLFYKAITGDELQYALYQMLQQTMGTAIVQSDISDKINEAFYPVDKISGAPLEPGNVINLDGEKIGNSVSALSDEQKKAGYGMIGWDSANGLYTVQWTDQNVSGDGWHGTVYEKAKEDFIGGNTVRTNDGNAVIQAKSYKPNEDANPIPLKDSIVNGPGRILLETPRVNVNELDFLKNDTQWTVYLGTEIKDIQEHLQKLYENIRIEQVITAGQDTDGDGLKDKVSGDKNAYLFTMQESALDKLDPKPGATPQYIYLKDVIKKITGQDSIDWTTLIEKSELEGDDNTGIVFPYDLYGQDCPGTLTLKLTKDHDIEDHVTTETGSAVETYSLKAVFSPLYLHIPAGQSGTDPWEYHIGDFGLRTCGLAAGVDDCINEHTINVFAKKLQIKKVDQSQQTITGSNGATFGLYRGLSAEELQNPDIERKTLSGLEGYYTKVQTLTTENGVVTSDPLKQLSNIEDSETAYYLVEETAPAGYNTLEEVLKVTIDMSENSPLDHNTWTPTDDTLEPYHARPDPYVLSDWLQEATIKVTGLNGEPSGFAIRELPDGQHEVQYDHENDTTDASVTYKIINSSGAELPNAGGPGTVWIYLIGSLLLLGCGIALVTRRRMRI